MTLPGSSKLSRMMMVAAGLMTAVSAAAQTAGTAAPTPAPAPPPTFSVAVGGDLLGPYFPVSQYGDKRFAEIKRIASQADLAIANFEASAFDLRTFTGWPASENGGGTPVFNPEAVADLATWIDAVSVANNHATDWGHEGMLATRKTLNAAGIVTAGSGKSEDEARAPVYFTKGAARVALVSAASTFTSLAIPAGPGEKNGFPTNPRPGINVLRNTEVRIAPKAIIDAMRPLQGERSGPPGPADEIQVGSSRFRVGENVGRVYQADKRDEAKIVTSIAEARGKADFVAFAIHAHETASGGADDPEPAAFQTELFHKVIDAGADLVLRTGPHAIGGIEIYKGRPILYGMGSLVFQFGGLRRLTWPSGFSMDLPDVWFESALVTTDYAKGKLRELRIYPLMLESSKNPTDGLPSLATGADARRILARVQAASARWGTKIEIKGDIGIIRPDR